MHFLDAFQQIPPKSFWNNCSIIHFNILCFSIPFLYFCIRKKERNENQKICTKIHTDTYIVTVDKNNESRMNSKINSICVHFQSPVFVSKEFPMPLNECATLEMHFPNAKTHLSRGFGIYFSNKFIFVPCVCVCMNIGFSFTQFISIVYRFFCCFLSNMITLCLGWKRSSKNALSC